MHTKIVDICLECGRPAKEHHIFEPVTLPARCQCDPHAWGDIANIPEPCDRFKAIPGENDVCTNCEHEKACHK